MAKDDLVSWLLDLQVKVAMNYKKLCQEEPYQIYILMSAGNSQQQIAELLGRHKSTISRDISHNTCCRDNPVCWPGKALWGLAILLRLALNNDLR